MQVPPAQSWLHAPQFCGSLIVSPQPPPLPPTPPPPPCPPALAVLEPEPPLPPALLDEATELLAATVALELVDDVACVSPLLELQPARPQKTIAVTIHSVLTRAWLGTFVAPDPGFDLPRRAGWRGWKGDETGSSRVAYRSSVGPR